MLPYTHVHAKSSLPDCMIQELYLDFYPVATNRIWICLIPFLCSGSGYTLITAGELSHAEGKWLTRGIAASYSWQQSSGVLLWPLDSAPATEWPLGSAISLQCNGPDSALKLVLHQCTYHLQGRYPCAHQCKSGATPRQSLGPIPRCPAACLVNEIFTKAVQNGDGALNSGRLRQDTRGLIVSWVTPTWSYQLQQGCGGEGRAPATSHCDHIIDTLGLAQHRVQSLVLLKQNDSVWHPSALGQWLH